ncbi:MAG: NUDIX domain-containing protein [Candidatus Odinarchaeota archaeon]|nr:NUDIX domain-containing protein [Candidatus Odinarchaeota archaeon]
MPYPKEYACHFLGVGGVIIHENKVLLVKLNYGYARGKWVIPGGLVECGETLQEAIVREIKEETGLVVKPIGIVGIRALVRKSDNLTDVYCTFVCQLESSPNSISVQQSELEDVKWFSLDEIDSNPEIVDFTRVMVKKAVSTRLMTLDTESNELAKSRKYLKKFEQFWADPL